MYWINTLTFPGLKSAKLENGSLPVPDGLLAPDPENGSDPANGSFQVDPDTLLGMGLGDLPFGGAGLGGGFFLSFGGKAGDRELFLEGEDFGAKGSSSANNDAGFCNKIRIISYFNFSFKIFSRC